MPNVRSLRRSRRACLLIAVMLAGSGCAAASGSGPLSGIGSGGGCYPTPAAAGGPLPYSLGEVSAAPGTTQGWLLGGTPAGLGPYSRDYLLHISGLSWTRSFTFPSDVHPQGLSAISGLATWIWGYQGRYRVDSQRDKPFLEQLSEDGFETESAPFLDRVFVRDLVSEGYNDAWLEGEDIGPTGPSRGLVVAHWDGTTWQRVSVPAGVRALGPLSASPHVWGVASAGFDVNQSLLHWTGSAWSAAYTPPRRLATHGRVPQGMTVAASGNRAWVAYLEAGTDSGSNARPGPEPKTISAYYNGRKWRAVSLPASAEAYGVAQLTTAGGDAWALPQSRNLGAVLYSSHGSNWCTQTLPHRGRRACPPTSISAASPTYVVADTSFSSGPCHSSYAFVYEGQRWRPLRSQPAR